MASNGINLIGHVTSNLGLGVAARNTAALLDEMHMPFVTVDVATSLKQPHRDSLWDARMWTERGPAPYRVNLFQLNPPELRTQVRFRQPWLHVDSRLNATVPFWELSKLPAAWIDVMRRLDVVLAPTLFIRDLALAADLGDDVEVLHFPQTSALPDGVAADRERWGFARDQVVFVSSFDLSSDLSRKNPAGTVAAFQSMRAATDASTAARARLILKVNNPKGDRSQAVRLKELHTMIGGDPAIRVIAESLAYSDVLSLYASADVFVSLHRAEGLGLGLLEAMMLGVPVIATGYSGNLDFMTPRDSRLVGYTLIPVEGTSIGSYDSSRAGESQMWAEPDLTDAARGMLELMDDTHRRELAAAAHAAGLVTRANPARSAAIERLLDLADSAPPASRLTELQRLPEWYWRTRGLAGRTLRAAGLRR